MAPGTAGAQTGKGPAVTDEQRAAALARPALVYIEIEWSAYVWDEDGILLNEIFEDGDPFLRTAVCSGFFVNPDGYIATAGHCVDAGNNFGGFGYELVDELAEYIWKAGIYDDASLEDVRRFAHANWTVEGEAKGSLPDRTINVQYGVARSNLKDTEIRTARVVDFESAANGDVALLKVDESNLPSLEMSPDRARVGEPVLAIGYPGAVEDVTDVDAGLEPSSKAGSVSSRKASGGIPVIEINAEISKGMSGGPAVGFDGRVMGVISFRPASQSQGISFAIDASVLRDLLTQNNVANRLGPMDATYRQGLAEFYEGDYQAAVASFTRVLGAVPWHAQAQEFRQQANELRLQNRSRDGGGLPAGLIAGAIAVLVLVGLALALRRGGKRVQTADTAGAGPETGVDGGIESLEPSLVGPDTSEPEGAPTGGSNPEGPARLESSGTLHPLAAVGSPRFCGNCGSSQDPRARFCPGCGNRVEKTA
nr:hypothetical protein [uncultured bacterium]